MNDLSPATASWLKEVDRVSCDLEKISIDASSTRSKTTTSSERNLHDHSSLNSMKPSLGEFKVQLTKVKPAIDYLSKTSQDQYDQMIFVEERVHDRFFNITVEYNQVNEKLISLQKSAESSSEVLKKLDEELAKVTKEYDQVKRQLEEKSNEVVDASPLIQMKLTLKIIKEDIRTMDLEIGLLEHVLFHKKRNLIQ